MPSNKIFIGCGIAVIVALVLVVGALVAGNLLIPDVPQLIPSGINSVFVNVTQPVNGVSLVLNQPVTVFVEAFGDQPIQGIQLLFDGKPLSNGTPTPAGGKKMMASWVFTPDKKGEFILIARATTQSGQDSISKSVTIHILQPDQIPQPLALGGTTIPLVINNETDQIDQGAEQEGGVPAPPPPGFTDQGSMENPPPPPPETGSQDVPDEPTQKSGGNLIPIKFSIWAQNLTKYLIEINLPEAPKLDGGANQCDGILVLQDNSIDELGFFLYRLNPGKQTFDQVATLDGRAGKTAFSYHDPGLASGKYLYYLSAFNSAGESASNIIPITVDAPQCTTAKPPEFGEKSILIDPAQKVERAYCYSSASGMPWVRLPFGQDNFIYPVNGKIDLAPYWNLIPLPQPTPPQVTLNMDCWGWSGTALNYLGNSSHTFGGEFDPTQEPNPDGTLGEPPKNMVASPYNATITDDPNVCKDHVPTGIGLADQCQVIMATHGGYHLVWTYNRFGPCNPQAEICDTNLQPADGFNIYIIKKDKAEDYTIHPLGKGFTYVPALQYGEYFVRAYSNTYGESGDSNHVLFSQPLLETTIEPSYIDHWVWRVWNYDGSVPHWENSPYGLMPGELRSGYAFTCLNSCSIPQYRDGWYTGYVNFLLPENVDIHSARLNWKNKSYTTSGTGFNKTITNCGVSLKTIPGGISQSEFYGGYENYDVTEEVLIAKYKNLPAILFSFAAPMELKPGVRWDRCLWTINNLSLTILYH